MRSDPRPRIAQAPDTEAPRGEISLRSVQPLWVLWIVQPAVTLLLVVAMPDQPPLPAWVLALIGASLVLPLLLLGRLVIELRGAVLHWHYGFVGWPRWRLPLARIDAIERTRAPVSHAGIQAGKARSVYTARLGGPALAITRRDGHRIVLGTPDAARLAQFIDARRPGQR